MFLLMSIIVLCGFELMLRMKEKIEINAIVETNRISEEKILVPSEISGLYYTMRPN